MNPTITCPQLPQFGYTATSGQSAPVSFTPAEADDNSGTVTVTYSQDPGSLFPFGQVTNVLATATDPSGNTATCTIVVFVQLGMYKIQIY